MTYGLLTHPLIARLIHSESDVKNRIGLFIQGMAEPIVPVAGPPSDDEMRKLGAARRRGEKHLPTLRVVELKCEKVERLRGVTRERAVRVTASADHMELIQAWDRRRQWAARH